MSHLKFRGVSVSDTPGTIATHMPDPEGIAAAFQLSKVSHSSAGIPFGMLI